MNNPGNFKIFKTVLTKKSFCVPISFVALSSFTQIYASKPNVIFIVTDDQGYGDLGCNGNPWLKTPNIDKLNYESVHFSNFHSGTTSAPTRAGLMTGKYCNKVGVWHTVKGREMLDVNEITLAQNMKDAGYSTAIFGKWHLGDNYPFRPQDRGFDEVLTFDGGGVGQQPDYWNNDYFDDTYFHNGKPEKFKGYCTNVWFDETIRFIKKNKNKPFFCYLATNAPHHPYNVADKYSAPYKNNLAITNANFYGMIANIDENVGKLRSELKKMGLDENTILVYMSDNGTATGVKFNTKNEVVSGYNAGMRGIKGSPYDGGHRVPLILHWPKAGIDKGKELSTLTSYIDFAPTILELCNVLPASNQTFDGKSLKPLILSTCANWPERILIVDNQREEFLIKGKQYVVMTDQWRMVGKNELYEIKNDVGQNKNVATEHPDVVEKLQFAYEQWWTETSQNGGKYSYVKLGSSYENPVRLNCHSAHNEKGMPAWSQEDVREGKGDNGFWPVEVSIAGDYEFELCRWPKESKLKMDEVAPETPKVEGVEPLKMGRKLIIKKAHIKIGDLEQKADVIPSAKSVKFTIALKAGKTMLQTWLIDDKDVVRGAYYVYVTKRN